MMTRYNTLILFLFLLFFSLAGSAQLVAKQPNMIPAGFRVTEEEMRLYRMINDYRRRYDLPPIPLSASLSYVASTHVKDLFFNHPDQDPCNFHSWSDKGPWKAFCYPRDENKKNSVWDKPREITGYKGKGYEIVYWENSSADIDSVFNLWRSVGYFNSFLMNTGKWQGTKWEAIGIGVYENYACAWFGQQPDPSGAPLLIGESPVKKEAVDAPKPQQAANPETKTEAVANNEQPAPALSTASTAAAAFTYNIIIRSNVPLKDTTKIMKLYSEKGFTNVKSFEKDGKARISVFETRNRAEATAKLKEIKAKYREAWLLKH